jgi:glycosyltransferase involved in cell wall biosynthesis
MRRLQIGIDGSPLSIPFHCGTRNYSENLLKALAEIDKYNIYFIFCSKAVTIPKQKNFILVKTPALLPILRRQFLLSYFAGKLSLDLFHYLNPYGDVFFNHPVIVTMVHDTRLAKTYPWFSRFFFNRLICEITRYMVFSRTRAFITPTNVVKRELLTFKNKINVSQLVKVVPEGVDKKFFPKKTVSKNGSYLLCLGDFSLRKNVHNILLAYLKLPSALKARFSLKIVSSSKLSTKTSRQLISRLGLQNRVSVCTNVSDKKLIELYRGAYCFLFPSLYEGFGLPILEAMAAGCPVITSNYGAMKEVAGNAAIFVNPRSPISISNAIVRIASKPDLLEDFVRRGIKRSSRFSWRSTAANTLKFYKQTIASNI